MALEYFADNESGIHRRHRTLPNPDTSDRQDPLDPLNEIVSIILNEFQPSRCPLIELAGKLLHQQFCQFLHPGSRALEIVSQGFRQMLELPQSYEQAPLFLLCRFVQSSVR